MQIDKILVLDIKIKIRKKDFRNTKDNKKEIDKIEDGEDKISIKDNLIEEILKGKKMIIKTNKNNTAETDIGMDKEINNELGIMTGIEIELETEIEIEIDKDKDNDKAEINNILIEDKHKVDILDKEDIKVKIKKGSKSL